MSPSFSTVRFRPVVITLQNRDHELGRAVDDLGKRAIYRFHAKSPERQVPARNPYLLLKPLIYRGLLTHRRIRKIRHFDPFRRGFVTGLLPALEMYPLAGIGRPFRYRIRDRQPI